MPDSRFDPAKAITFDFGRGRVELGGEEKAPAVLVPASALGDVCKAAGADAARAFAVAIGEAIGGRVSARLASEGGARAASLEVIVDHFGGEIALAGFGTTSVERWGKALVVVVDGSPLGGSGDAIVEAIVEAAVAKATGAQAKAALLAREGERARFLLAGERGVAKARALLAEGKPWSEAVVRLHDQRGEA